MLAKQQHRITVEVPNPTLRKTLVQRRLVDRTDLALGLCAVLVATLLLVNLSLMQPVNGTTMSPQSTPQVDENGNIIGGTSEGY